MRAQHGTDMRLQSTESLGCKRAGKIELLHQAHRAQRKRESALDFSPSQEIHLQTAAAEVQNQPRSKAPHRYGEYRLAYQPRLFRCADGNEFNASFAIDTGDQGIAIDGLAHGAGGDRPVLVHFVTIEQVPEMQESFHRTRHRARIQSFSCEYVVSQANRPARAGKFADFSG